MILCPHCLKHLEMEKTLGGVYWRCPSCEGRAMTLPVLRKQLEADYLNSLWKCSIEGERAGVRCVFCQNEMQQVLAGPICVDVCRNCQTVWFDTSEFECAPRLEEKEAAEKNSLPQKAREILAMAEIAHIREKAEAESDDPMTPPASPWQMILTVFGLPVEENEAPLSTLPWLTWTFALLITAATATALLYRPTWMQEFGLIPAQVFRHDGLTFATSFFLHAGWFHLLGNLYFLLVFGDNVEDFIGKIRYLILVTCSALAGDVSHILLDTHSSLPLIGASGGVAGILGFYAVQFPHAKICLFFRYFVWMRWIRIPAVYLFILWLGLQFLTAWQQKMGVSHISGAGHLGGAFVGILFALAGKWTALPNRHAAQ